MPFGKFAKERSNCLWKITSSGIIYGKKQKREDKKQRREEFRGDPAPGYGGKSYEICGTDYH